MPKESRRKSSKDLSVAGHSEGLRPDRRHHEPHGPSMNVPQVTITGAPEQDGSSRELPQEDWGRAVDEALRRKLSSSSISSTGSSAVESEDDLLSDSESSRSRGIVTLEQLGDVSTEHTHNTDHDSGAQCAFRLMPVSFIQDMLKASLCNDPQNVKPLIKTVQTIAFHYL